MEARELMKGNLVMYYNKIHTIQTIGQWCHTDLSSDELPIDKLKRIPLTDEWLLRFGFDKKSKNQEWILNKIRICETVHKGLCWVDNDIDFIEVNNVHQLQNLYFALTGQELELK